MFRKKKVHAQPEIIPKPEKEPDNVKTIEAMFPETGMTDFEKRVASETGLSPDSISQAINEPSTTEEAYAKIMGNLVLDKGDRRKLMSDLSARDVHLFSVSYARAALFHNKVLENFLDEELMLRVSKKRGGRADIIKLSGAIREHELKKSWWRRMGSMGQQGGMQGGI